MPDYLIPPKGAASDDMRPVLMPTMPYSSASATRQTPFEVRGVEIGGKAVDGIVGFSHDMIWIFEADEWRKRPERFFLSQPHRADHLSDHSRFKKGS